MKLHLTATSERGKPVTKSGNEELYIRLQDQTQAIVMEMFIGFVNGNVVVKDFWVGDMDSQEIENYYKPKTAKCPTCFASYCEPSMSCKDCESRKPKTARGHTCEMQRCENITEGKYAFCRGCIYKMIGK